LVPFEVERAGVLSINDLFLKKRESIEVDQFEQCHENFENLDSWLPNMRTQILALGKRLDAERNFVHFPLVTIVEELENICSAVRLLKYDYIPLDWVSSSLRELRIPYSMLVEAYFQIWHTRSGDRFIVDFLAGAISALLLNWVAAATRQMDDQNDDKRFCLQAVRSQQMEAWINTLIIHNVKVPLSASYDSESRRQTATLTAKNLDAIKKELKRLDMIFSAEYRR
jgi:hypothetical protein